MTADQRVAYAREYLDGARKRKVTELPPSLLVRECAELRRALGQVLDVIERPQRAPRPPVCGCGYSDCSACAIGQAEDGTEPYCTTCGQWAGMFLGMDGWHHFRGDPAPGGQRELYDAGHQAVIGWTAPTVLAPAELAAVLDALAVAAEYRRYRPSLTCEACAVHPADLCEACATDLDRADEYDAMTGRLGDAP